MVKKLIALTGQKRSGKDTVASFLEDDGYERVAFAGPLKGMIKSLFLSAGMSEEEAEERINGSEAMKEEPLKILHGKSARFAMQRLGTEWRDFFSENLWSDIVKAKIDQTEKVVLTDMRFIHEANFADQRDGYLVRVRRAGQKRGVDLHPSETEMENINVDATIYNHGTLVDLEEIAKYILPLYLTGEEATFNNFGDI